MAVPATAVVRVRPSGNNLNGAMFAPAGNMGVSDLAATSATGSSPVVTSATYTFVAGDVNAYLFIQSGTNWLAGWYKIVSVAGGAATLDASAGTVRYYPYLNLSIAATGCASTASPTSGTGTIDYTQQNSAVAATSDYTSTASTTITSATAGFHVMMIGNAIRLSSGTGVTTGYYFITAVASATSLTVDRNSGTYTAGVGKVGGGAATHQRVCNDSNSTGDKVVAGNTIFILGGGTDTPSSEDYTAFTGFVIPTSGDNTSGKTRFIGENGRPRLKGNGLMFYYATNCHFENLYLDTSSNSNGTSGILMLQNGGAVVRNVVINLQDKSSITGIAAGTNSTVEDCEIIGGTTATDASQIGIDAMNNRNGIVIRNCHIHHIRGRGVSGGNTAYSLLDSKLYKNVGYQVHVNAGSLQATIIKNNTIDAGLDHGIYISDADALSNCTVVNNLITNHTGTSKYGINVAGGTTLVNNKIKQRVDGNCLYNNTSNYNNISAGAHDQYLDPGYVDAPNGDFTPTNTALEGTAI